MSGELNEKLTEAERHVEHLSKELQRYLSLYCASRDLPLALAMTALVAALVDYAQSTGKSVQECREVLLLAINEFLPDPPSS